MFDFSFLDQVWSGSTCGGAQARVICLASTRGSSIPSVIHTNKPKKSRVTQDEFVTLELNVLEVSFLSPSHPELLPVKQKPFKM